MQFIVLLVRFNFGLMPTCPEQLELYFMPNFVAKQNHNSLSSMTQDHIQKLTVCRVPWP